MEKLKKLFGGIDLNWKKLIIFAIATFGAFTTLKVNKNRKIRRN